VVFVSWTSGSDWGGDAVYSKAFRLASVKTLIFFSVRETYDIKLEEDAIFQDKYSVG